MIELFMPLRSLVSRGRVSVKQVTLRDHVELRLFLSCIIRSEFFCGQDRPSWTNVN